MKSKRVAMFTRAYILTFIKWIIIAIITGSIGGFIGGLFSKSVEAASSLFQSYSFLLYFLPLAGVIIAALYRFSKIYKDPGTNLIINSIREKNDVPLVIAPLIFISTVLTHLCGGSVGREGAALQLGGSIGAKIGKLFRLDEKDMHLAIMCGMSGVFSALFGTPVTAVIFAVEVISVGIVYYAGLLPCIVSSLTSFYIASFMGAKPVRFTVNNVPQADIMVILQVAALAALCALVSILFCIVLKGTGKYLRKFIKNDFLRVIAGGTAIILLTLILGTRDYNGLGTQIIAKAINGEAVPYDFILKIVFTALSIGAGYKGGEIVPTFFIGATFGCFAGGLLGLDPGFAAAVGMISLFCAVVNCPVASFILSIEVFGANGFILFAVACVISYILSGYYGLYSSQKIMYSKIKAEYINKKTK